MYYRETFFWLFAFAAMSSWHLLGLFSCLRSLRLTTLALRSSRRPKIAATALQRADVRQKKSVARARRLDLRHRSMLATSCRFTVQIHMATASLTFLSTGSTDPPRTWAMYGPSTGLRGRCAKHHRQPAAYGSNVILISSYAHTRWVWM